MPHPGVPVGSGRLKTDAPCPVTPPPAGTVASEVRQFVQGTGLCAFSGQRDLARGLLLWPRSVENLKVPE